MSSFVLTVRNVRALRDVRWSPEGICLLVGSNGAGKTTVLLTLRMLRAAFDHGLPRAVADHLGGIHDLKNWQAEEDDPIEIGVDIDGLSWRVQLVARGASVDYLSEESLTAGDTIVYRKDALGNFVYRDSRLDADERLGLRAIADMKTGDDAIDRMATILRSMTVFVDPDLAGLRLRGSPSQDDRHLSTRGTNAFTMLRKWQGRREHRSRFEFVRTGLQAAFPGVFSDLDFDEAGRTTTVRIFRDGLERACPISEEANGLVALLVLLCDLAGAPDGGIVAIDEPENSLHPFAIRQFLALARQWASSHDLTVLLATHSPVLISEMNAEPSRVFILRGSGSGSLVPATSLRDQQWLARFRLGDLYVDGELDGTDSSELPPCA